MEFRPLTENESAIVAYYGAKRLATIHKDKFVDTPAFMNAWIQHRAPQWKDIVAGDTVQLTTETDRKDIYMVAYISLEKDEISFCKYRGGKVYPARLISDMPYMKVIERSKKSPVKKHVNKNSLF